MKNRIYACTIHFLISTALFLIVFSILWLFWYPGPYFKLMGISKMLGLIAIVDITLGPLITLIIFNTAKKSLKKDLTLIGILQIAALMYGIYIIHKGRPVYVVYFNLFTVVTAAEIPTQSHPLLPFGHIGPKIIGARMPKDIEENTRIIFSAAQGGPDLPQLPEYYVPYEQTKPQALARAKPLAELKRYNTMDASAWSTFIASLDRNETDLVYLPLRAKVKDGAVILDKKTGDVVKMVLLNPW